MAMRYFAVQGVATAAWWAVISASPTWRTWFAFGDDGASLLPFFPADLLFWCLGSLAAAWGIWAEAAWAGAVRWLVAGAMCGSVLHAAAVACLVGAGWPGVLVMAVACVATGWFTCRSLA